MSALERQGIVDPARELIAGWSFGGIMSALATGHNTHFKAAIAGVGISDLASMSLTTGMGHSFIIPYFSDPVRNRALYDAHSPVTFAHDVHIPVLLLHGYDDARVPALQSRLFYTGGGKRQQGYGPAPP